jgi:hypothetical protein
MRKSEKKKTFSYMHNRPLRTTFIFFTFALEFSKKKKNISKKGYPKK